MTDVGGMAAYAVLLYYSMERHIRESAELPERERGGILEAIKAARARLVLNVAFDL